ncbi:MAG: DUF11 domain-containing protein, partial [Chloroflexi bacterium]|nr:DUF11 domain-containing protein [Chloroflexota bacterium]
MNEKTGTDLDQPERRRWSRIRPFNSGWIPLLALLTVMVTVIFCSAQASVIVSQPESLDVTIEPEETADYSQWPAVSFRRVDPLLATLMVEAHFAERGLDPATAIAMDASRNPPSNPQTNQSATGVPSGENSDTDTGPGDEIDPLVHTPENPATATAIYASQTAIAEKTLTPASATPDGTQTPTITPTGTVSVSPTVTGTTTATVTGTVTTTATTTVTITPTVTPTATVTPTLTITPTTTPTTTPIPMADLYITKSVNASNPQVGDTIVFTITVGNNGPDTATGVQVRDKLPLGVSHVTDNGGGSYNSSSGLWNIGTLAASGTATLQITVRVGPGTGGSTITNTAAIDASDQMDPGPGPNSASASFTVQSADLQVTKTVDNPNPIEGTTITFTVTVQNNGPNNASSVEVTDVLPTGLTYEGHTSYEGTNYFHVPGVGGDWNVGNLNVGAAKTLEIDARVNPSTAGSTITNTANVTASSLPDTNLANNTASANVMPQLQPYADLAVTKSVDNSSPHENTNVTYTVTVTNNGPDTATGVRVQDTLPSGITYVSDSASQGTYAAGFWDIGTLTNGATATLNITVQVETGTAGSTISNVAAIDAFDPPVIDANPGNNSSSVDIMPQGQLTADVRINTQVDDSYPSEGQSIRYTLTVTNDGPDATSNVVVQDNLPAGVTYAGDDGGGAYNNGTGIWTIGDLANGASATLHIDVTVNSGTAGSTITNTASITSSSSIDPNAGNNSNSATVTMLLTDLAVTKTVSNPNPVEGGTIIYTISVTNNGPDQARGVRVTDNLPAEVSLLLTNPSKGNY